MIKDENVRGTLNRDPLARLGKKDMRFPKDLIQFVM
jgi:hypothetical protein